MIYFILTLQINGFPNFLFLSILLFLVVFFLPGSNNKVSKTPK